MVKGSGMHWRHRDWLGGCIGLVVTAALAFAGEPIVPAKASQETEFFESRIRPVLVENCQSCHGAKRQQGGLRLDSRTAALKGSDTGPVLIPGNPDKSLLIQAIRHAGDVKMPPKGK